MGASVIPWEYFVKKENNLELEPAINVNVGIEKMMFN